MPKTVALIMRGLKKVRQIYSTWFTSHILKHAVSGRPLLFLFNGDSFHYTLELMISIVQVLVQIRCQLRSIL